MNDVNKNLGHATAYGYAKSKGYTGTEDEFAALMADYAAVGERAEAAATAAAASATAASGSASDSAASATAAAGSSTAASTAAGNASQAAQTATTKASEAAQSATAAAGSATTASTKATEAAQSATAAAGSATTAGTAATNAQAAQTAAETAQTAAETAQGAAEDAAESVSASAAQIAQNTADISSVKNAIGEIDATLITEEASGAIATFTDGADGYPMRSVAVALEPIQDLHGQANPYPAGGGKNRYGVTQFTDIEKNSVTFHWLNESEIRITGTATANIFMYSTLGDRTVTLSAGTYSLSCNMPDGSSNGCLRLYQLIDGAYTLIKDYIRAGSTTTITVAEETTYCIQVFIASGQVTNFTLWIQIESGSTVTTYAPYSNICPISGRSEVGVTRAGKNLLKMSSFNLQGSGVTYVYDEQTGVMTTNGTATSSNGINVATVVVPTNSVFSAKFAETVNTAVYIRDAVTNENITYISRYAPSHTINPGTYYIRLSTSFNQTTSGTISEFQIEPGTAATSYEAPDIQHITIPLGQTVYGGTVDAVSGVLTVDRRYTTIGNESIARVTGSDYANFEVVLSTNKPLRDDTKRLVISSVYKGESFNSASAANDNYIFVSTNGTTIRIKDTGHASLSAAEYRELMADVELCYVLATPLTIQLSAQQLTTLLGTNNVWSDGGNVDVDYVADTKLYISKVIAAALA